MSKILIKANPTFRKERPENKRALLNISEFFCDTIQGEGINIGHPATFIRLQHCVLDCVWCDTAEVWKYGNPYSFDELFSMMESSAFNLIYKLKNGQHLVFTGGSPLIQQSGILFFIDAFKKKYGFKPYIEIENECVLEASPAVVDIVNCWNNSPKLSNSGNMESLRHRPRIIEMLSKLSNSWFKFVVADNDDWKEIEEDYLGLSLVKRDQIILMPLGDTQEELFANRQVVVDIAIREGVRYITREHIVLWNKKTGV